MKRFPALFGLAVCSLMLASCGGATTNEPLPEGQAPRDLSDVGDADPPHPAADDRDAMVDDVPEPAPDGDASTDPAERLSAPGISYVLPDGWSVGPDRQMRLLTLVPPAEYAGAELAIAKWPGDVGGLEMNVSRWAGQVGLSPQDVGGDFEIVTVDDARASWMPLINQPGGKAMLALWVPRGSNPAQPTETWTFKLTGTPEQVEALSPAVRGWVDSIRFEDTP